METKSRITPENIVSLQPHQTFVFGSNLAGRHGRGAAKDAMKWGAKIGEFFGQHGQTFAIPTKNQNLDPLEVYRIKWYVARFCEWAALNPDIEFLVTPIGCGLAQFTPEVMAPMFKPCVFMDNVCLPQCFWEIY